MKTWLVVYILLGGVWTPGAEVRPGGWAPRAYPSLAECERRRAFAMRAVRGVSETPSKWFCAPRPDMTLAEMERAARRRPHTRTAPPAAPAEDARR